MTESNIKIAQFMGYKYQEKLLIGESDYRGTYTEYFFLSKTPIKFEEYKGDKFIDEDWYRENKFISVFKAEELQYDRDWNALMDVVDHIENYTILQYGNWVNITIGSGLYCVIQDDNFELFEFIASMETKIESVYEAILKFILVQ